MIMPNFLIIGTQKAGTTSLYYYLKDHPQIYMSPIKEPGFFAFEGEKPQFCGPGDQEAYRSAITEIEAYYNLFKDTSNEIAIGEATTWYLQSPKAPERIRCYVPKAKLIAILRNPVDRAYSAFFHAIRDNRETLSDFAQALLEEDKRIKKDWGFLWRYKHMGFYATQLKQYFKQFDNNQIRVYLYEDFKNNPNEILKDIFSFLNVDETFTPEVLTHDNISGIPKSKILDTFLSQKNPIKKFFKPLIPSRVRKQIVNQLKMQNMVKPECPLEVRLKLGEVFREDILELQKLLQRDLSTWLK